uniref:Remorin C-terminal domain-containing protein n=1 Tax=Leersia perrieri TaxID=77586 RepID=A0A0D9W0G4_9ORYZ
MLHDRHAPPEPEPEQDQPEPEPEPELVPQHHPSAPTAGDVADDEHIITTFRDIHPLTPSTSTPPPTSWDTASSSHRSVSSEEQFMTMSREFTAMVAAGAGAAGADADHLTSIGEVDDDHHLMEETNPLAIVPDTHPIAATPARSRASLASQLEVVPAGAGNSSSAAAAAQQPAVEARQVKKEEVETKVSAWQTAEVAKINNRFKREEIVINGWETEQVDKASAWLKKIERKLDEQRAKALEKTQNEIAKARRKAEEKRASAEAKRGLKLAKVLELANFMKAVGRVPTKRSFF